MQKIEKGAACTLKGSGLAGTVETVFENGSAYVSLDIGGTVTTPIENLVPADAPPDDGRFKDGHAYHPSNPEYDQLKVDAREVRQNMLTELAPFFNNIGKYINQIPKVEKKIDAVAKMAPYVLPALSRVEFTDETPRLLTEEQRLAKMLQQQQQKK